jgi:hypothetical protein
MSICEGGLGRGSGWERDMWTCAWVRDLLMKLRQDELGNGMGRTVAQTIDGPIRP